MTTPHMQVRTITTLCDLASLETAWAALFARSGSANPFLSWEWNFAWAKEFAPDCNLLVKVCEAEGRPVLIAPLIRNRRTLSFMKDMMLADYGDLLMDADSAAAISALVSDLRAERARRILLHTMRADSPAISALCEAFGSSGALWRQRRLTINPVVRLSGTWDDFLRGRPKRLRQELRTTQNHLGRGGEWSFEEATQADAAHEIYDALVELHTSRQEGKPGSSVFGELRRRSFLKSIIGELSPTVETHLSAIRWQGRIVSAAYSLQCGDTFFYWTPSFDPNLRSMSLGKLHVAKLIQSCFGRSLKVFDFMGGDEPYKVQWTSQALDILNIDVYAGHLGYWCADAAAWGFNTARVIKRKSKLLGRAWTAASKVGSR